jgi:arabinoxylan arabinofuranohydrolase
VLCGYYGDSIEVRDVDFGSRPVSSFTASVASASRGGSIELHLDSVDEPKIASLPVPSTGEWNTWQTRTTTVSGATGTHHLYFLFRGDGTGQLFNFDYCKFNKKGFNHPKRRNSEAVHTVQEHN